jgi:hypothetical protein
MQVGNGVCPMCTNLVFPQAASDALSVIVVEHVFEKRLLAHVHTPSSLRHLLIKLLMMLRLSQRIVRPNLVRALRVPALTNALHHLPDLPYAYDVRISARCQLQVVASAKRYTLRRRCRL